MTLVLFYLQHAAVVAVLLLAAAGAGTLVRARESFGLRAAAGLALLAHAIFFLGITAQLRVIPLAVVIVAAAAAAFAHPVRPRRAMLFLLPIALPLFLLALQPPLAFDETLYHLPFVRAFAEEGAMHFLPDIRFAIFPQFHELLCVPVYLFAGDVATHLVTLTEVMLTATLLLEWRAEGRLAAAFLLGSPLLVQLATVAYVDAALMLFVTAGFFCLDRRRFALAGFLFGTACSVKYLGGYFALAALAIALLMERRGAVKFALVCAAAALPTTLWIFAHTGNPLFPFGTHNAWTLSLPSSSAGWWRVLWDVTFARERTNLQPPITPLLIPAVILTAAAALRDLRARAVLAVIAGYLAVFTFIVRDARYLASLLPILGLAASVELARRWPRLRLTWLSWLAIAPGIAYACYRLSILGPPPVTPAQRTIWLESHVPEYAALTHAGAGRVYVCGAEQLKYYAAGELLGDFNGPYSYDRILGDPANLRRLGVRYFLVAKRTCAPPTPSAGMQLVYEDAAAQLWRVPLR
jgi:hypothetical protein